MFKMFESNMPTVGKIKLVSAVLCVFILYIIAVSVDSGLGIDWCKGFFGLGLFCVLLYVSGLPQYGMKRWVEKNAKKD